MKKLILILITITITILGSVYLTVEKFALMNEAIVIENGKIYFTKPICTDSIASPVNFGCCVSMDTLILNGDTLIDFSNIQ